MCHSYCRNLNYNKIIKIVPSLQHTKLSLIENKAIYIKILCDKWTLKTFFFLKECTRNYSHSAARRIWGTLIFRFSGFISDLGMDFLLFGFVMLHSHSFTHAHKKLARLLALLKSTRSHQFYLLYLPVLETEFLFQLFNDIVNLVSLKEFIAFQQW